MLTVLIPIYSIDKHLNEALLSIKNQTYREYTCHLLCKKFNEKKEIILIQSLTMMTDLYFMN